ncbi:hypothetical protein FGO68_gene15730 [Halteria grandinella]|uniref:Uncharacterized protein n=1 Tax=Halteria grandinella TaxID=5974 RepID=A0A8J8TB72_HALGN|nr:hypothetical protein FGO68_gene15730 [Halteria grandinella]
MSKKAPYLAQLCLLNQHPHMKIEGTDFNISKLFSENASFEFVLYKDRSYFLSIGYNQFPIISDLSMIREFRVLG